jgi:S-phase kinase-associated protein 1
MAVGINRNAEEGNGIITLLSSDGQSFEVRAAAALQSVIVTKVIEDFGPGIPIPVMEVSSEILEKVIEYCTYHADHPPRRIETIDDIDPWDVQFLNVDPEVLSLIALAAHYLDIPSLRLLACRKIAEIIQSYKTPERVREMLNIPNDFSPEEEAEIRRANQWAVTD